MSVRLAIESDSRAWGFPSPDSDYDCRFVYVAHLETYLSPWRTRDVIETPLIGLLDVNGWDLAKALRPLVKGNAVLIEWPMSPIVYRGDERFRDELRGVADQVADRSQVARHYLHLGSRQWALFDRNRSLKKVFYSPHPAMALRWLRAHPDVAVAPMQLPTLLDQRELPADLVASVADLTELESHTREMGGRAVPTPTAEFITAEFDRATDAFPQVADRDPNLAREITAAFFRKEVLAGSDGP